jgi:ubiquinone/menaquinone biosynthesis C-methylase UbiE
VMTSSSSRNSVDFDWWALAYETTRNQIFYGRVHQAVLKLVESRIRPGDLLDVGCGTGRLLRAAKLRWPDARLVGIDASPRMVEIARRLTPDASLQVGTAEALPLPDASIDVALSTISFHQWQDQLAGLREVVRVLRPGGYCFLADVSPVIWLSLWLPGQPRSQTRAEMRRLFRQAGLHVRLQKFVCAGVVLVTVGQRPADLEKGDTV